jgi:hypothetical protein
MALSLMPDKVLAEVRADAKARDDRLRGAEDLLRKYPGANWDGPILKGRQFDPENAAFEYISYAMSQLVWANPRWRVTTRRPRAQQMVAEAMGFGMNRWTVDTDFKTVLEDLAVDFTFSWSVAHVSPQPRPEHYEAEDPMMWPQVSRISPWDFGFDHRAKTWRQARMLWHRYKLDRDDLQRRARLDRKKPIESREGWDVAAVDSLSTSGSWDESSKGKHWLSHANEGPDRREVELLDVFLPTHRIDGAPGPEDGFNGTILTLGIARNGTGAVHLKPPRPAFGPRWGPYTVFGSYIVPDCPFPLSLLMACAGHIEQSTRLAQAVDNQVESYKRMMLIAAGQPQLAQLIKDGKNDVVHSLPNVAKLDEFVKQYEIGGTVPGNVAAEQRTINKRNRAMGMDEVQRGNVTGEGTATEVQFAVEAAMGRQGYIKGRFQDGVRRVGKSVAWYLFHMDEVIFSLGPDATEQLGLGEDEEAWFMGGSYDEGSGTTFDDLGLEIEPYSMERPTEQFLKARGELLGNVIQMAPLIAQAAQLGGDAKGLLDAYGDAFGMPNLSRLFPGIDSADLSAIQPEQAEPRLARDVGIAGLFKSIRPQGQGAQAGKSRQPGPEQFASAAG